MADKRTNIIIRFGIVYLFIAIAFVFVVVKVVTIQTTERKDWLDLKKRNEKTNIVVKPKRGNIYAEDGRLLASSSTTYNIHMDMRVEALKKDSLFYKNIDSLSICLSKMFKDKTTSQYKNELTKAFENHKSYHRVYSNPIPYYQLKELKNFPLYRLGRYKSGLLINEHVQRVRPFGSLAKRTIGNIHTTDTVYGISGLEQYYDKILTGKAGRATIQKIASNDLEVVVVEPIDGMDIVTTIDIEMQDISENALLEILRKYNAKSGNVIIMETKTGEVKSIVNMYQENPGNYREERNGALSDELEPGSTFKTMVLMALLDEEKINLNDTVDVGNGTLMYPGAKTPLTDHNAKKGGYGKISVANIIHGSSNIGMHKIVEKAYGEEQEGLVDKLREMKLTTPIEFGIKGTGTPFIKHPKENRSWSQTSLSAISRGYEIKIPPIYTLTYYNAIANNGKMITPFFVKSINKDGQVVKSYESQTITSSICKNSTLKDIQEVLLGVVEGELGTGKPVRSDVMHIAGKTGTARVFENGQYYNNRHRVSFCGYFPADNPQYTGIVVIDEPSISSAGLTSGVAFKNIAERIMALKSDIKPQTRASDSIYMENAILLPQCKPGNYKALQTVMKNIKLGMSGESGEWVKTAIAENETKIKPFDLSDDKIPDVRGMGAKDAIYLLEKLELAVQIQGRGKVISQSINPGTKAIKGRMIVLNLK